METLLDLNQSLATPAGLAAMVGILGYVLLEVLKGLIPQLAASSETFKRSVAALLGMVLGGLLAAPSSVPYPVWPHGVLAGLVGIGVLSTARGVGKGLQGKKACAAGAAKVVSLVLFCLVFATSCAGLQICQKAAIVLKDGSDPAKTKVGLECDGTTLFEVETGSIVTPGGSTIPGGTR